MASSRPSFLPDPTLMRLTDRLADFQDRTDFSGRLAEVGNFTPAFSVDGSRERTDDRRGPCVFDQVLEAMRRLYQVGVPYRVSLAATRHNVEEISSDEFFGFFFGEHGALYGWLFHHMLIGRSYNIDLMPTPEQRLRMWHRTWDIIRERQVFLADFWNHGTVTDGCISSGTTSFPALDI